MSDELKSILSEIAFPVTLAHHYIIDYNGDLVIDLSSSPLRPFGHELARLINTLDPKRERDFESTDERIKFLMGIAKDFSLTPEDIYRAFSHLKKPSHETNPL